MHSLLSWGRQLGHGILDIIFPPCCELCDQRLTPTEKMICASCLEALEYMPTTPLRLSVPQPWFLQEAWSLFRFEDIIQSLLHSIKYNRKTNLAEILIRHSEAIVLEHYANRRYDFIVPIPLHPRKFRERGYNQATPMAEILAGIMGATIDEKILKRIRYTGSQTKLGAQERSQNVAGAFGIGSGATVKNCRILLVDDVLTTGSTANSCGHILHQAGSKGVDLFTIARATIKNP